MKRERGMQILYRVLQRIHNINGILATPLEDYEYVKIKRAWVFGSLAKGSLEPHDVDIFIEVEGYSPDSCYRVEQPTSHIRKSRRKVRRMLEGQGSPRLHGGYRPDKTTSSYKQMNFWCLVCCTETLYKYLKHGIPSASVHMVHEDYVFPKLDVKQLIYPRCDFDFESAINQSYLKKYKKVARNLPS